MFRVGDRTLPGKLIRFLAVLASTLTVALAGDRSVTTSGRADLAGGEDKIDVREHVVDAVRVMFDAASVHYHRCLRAAVKSRSFDNFGCGHTADLRRDVWRITRGHLECCFPIVCARTDESVIDEVFLNEDVQYSVRKRDVSARLELQM